LVANVDSFGLIGLQDTELARWWLRHIFVSSNPKGRDGIWKLSPHWQIFDTHIVEEQ